MEELHTISPPAELYTDDVGRLQVMLDKLVNAAYNIGGEHVTELASLIDTADEASNLLFAVGYYKV